jgi:hypothetical protein
MAGGNLHVTQGDPSVECGHDESCSEHVRVDRTQSSSLADRSDPAVRCPSIEALPIMADEDGSFLSFAEGSVDSSGRAGHEWDQSRLVSLAHDPKRPMPSLEPEVLYVRPARLAHPQAVEAEQCAERRVGVVEALCGE